MASKPKKHVEIPGYYWDAATCRYYKEDPAHPRPKVFPSLADSNSHPKSASCPKHVLDILQKREIGFGKYSFEDRLVSLNLKNFHCIKELKPDSVCPANPSQYDVTFLKGGKYSTYLEFSSKSGSNYILQHKGHFFSSPKNFSAFKCFHSSSFSTIDLCEGKVVSANAISLFVVSSDSNTWKMSLWERSTEEDTIAEFHRPYMCDTPVWCCNKNDFTNEFVFGKPNFVIVCAFGSNALFYKKRVRGEVRSVQFDKQGSLIYTGMHTGHIEILDERANKSVFRTRLHNRGINETVLVYDEKQLICCAFDGMLCNFDLRMRKIFGEYYGHVHSPRKVPFSISEPNNLLCATGSDNITRLWSLGSGGDPIKYIEPPEDGHACRSWLVSDGYKCLLYQYQRSNTYIYGNGNIEILPDSKF